jgi:hypothetical protein
LEANEWDAPGLLFDFGTPVCFLETRFAQELGEAIEPRQEPSPAGCLGIEDSEASKVVH